MTDNTTGSFTGVFGSQLTYKTACYWVWFGIGSHARKIHWSGYWHSINTSLKHPWVIPAPVSNHHHQQHQNRCLILLAIFSLGVCLSCHNLHSWSVRFWRSVNSCLALFRHIFCFSFSRELTNGAEAHKCSDKLLINRSTLPHPLSNTLVICLLREETQNFCAWFCLAWRYQFRSHHYCTRCLDKTFYGQTISRYQWLFCWHTGHVKKPCLRAHSFSLNY